MKNYTSSFTLVHYPNRFQIKFRPGIHYYYILFISTLILISILTGCSKKETIVAKFGKHQITLAEFRVAYLDIIKQPTIFDSKKLREEFLDELIQRQLLAEQARKMTMDSDERLKYRINAYQDKCLREAHYQKVIKPGIAINEEDIEQAYQFSQEQRHIRHLFCETEERADSLYQLLQQGIPFESVAQLVFKDTAMVNSSGDLGWVNWEQMEYDLAMAAFRQPLFKYSKPLRSQFGYHILQVIDYKKNPLITRQQYLLHRKKAKLVLESKIGDKIAGEYIRKMMENVTIQVRPAVMKRVGERLVKILNRKPSPLDQMKPMQLSEAELVQLETNLWDNRHDILAEIDGRGLRVGEFISALTYVPYDAIYQSYKTALDFVFRDFVLTQEAKDMGLDNSSEVKLKTKLYDEYLLQSKLRRQVVRDITVNEDEIRTYYQANQATKYSNVSYDSVKNFIREQLLINKRQEAIANYIMQLSSNLEIKKYPELIHAYYDSLYQD